jgi:DNA polymerase
MDLITVDFETYYDKTFSLSKMTTEEYVRDPRFEVIGVGVKVNNGPTEWASGTHEQIKDYLHTFGWADAMVLAHNTIFDGAILSWLFDIRPRVWADTLCIARALHGVEVSGSLAALVERYGIGAKGTEVLNALGKRRADFTDEELSRYGDYCINDVELTYKLFGLMGRNFPRQELKIIDMTLRMFIQPVLDLDLGLLEQHLEDTKELKDKLLLDAGVDKKDLMSNPKFAGLLEILGVIPPMKTSLTTGKETYAFAKSDEGFKAFNKSTLEETRTQRFIDIAKRGLLPVPVKYYAAHTGRWGGADKINLQNLPSRGPNGKKLKRSIVAPDGYMLVDCDSSQIEARVLSWLAIYGVNREEDVTKDQRFVGKTTILGAGYGMGAVRFKDQLQSFGFDIELDEARRVINIYRETNFQITRLWNDASHTIRCMEQGVGTELGINNVISVDPTVPAIILPSGLQMRYEDLRGEQSERGVEYTYKVRRGRNRIYGGKVIENVCQAVARCIIGEQMLKISKRYHVVLTVHDSVVCCVPEDKVEEAQRYIEECMRWLPDWAEGLPIDCESGVAKSYGDCE